MSKLGLKPRRYLEIVLQLCLFAALGVATTFWLFKDIMAGVVIGLGVYFVSSLFLMIGDVVQINRELAEFRNGEESE